MDPGLSTSPNQFPDLGLSITGKGFSVKLFIDFKRHPASSDILFMRHLYVVLFDHILIASSIKFLILGSVIISMLSIFLSLPCNHQNNDGKQLPIIFSWNQLRKGLSV